MHHQGDLGAATNAALRDREVRLMAAARELLMYPGHQASSNGCPLLSCGIICVNAARQRKLPWPTRGLPAVEESVMWAFC